MSRRELLRRLRRIDRAAAGWRYEQQEHLDADGDRWTTWTAVSPIGVRNAVELPVQDDDVEHWEMRARWVLAARALAQIGPTPGASKLDAMTVPSNSHRTAGRILALHREDEDT